MYTQKFVIVISYDQVISYKICNLYILLIK